MLISQKKFPIFSERSAISQWQPPEEGRRHIHGDLKQSGFSVEFYEFFAPELREWPQPSQQGTLQLWVNLEGSARFSINGSSHLLRENQCAIFMTTNHRVKAARMGGEKHSFYVLEFSHQWLKVRLHQSIERTKPAIRRFLRHPERMLPYVECLPLPFSLLSIRKEFLSPPVPSDGAEMWYQAKTIEALAHTIYLPSNAMTGSQKRNQTRIEKARAMIERSIANPPSLEMIAHEVGCSMFHLSRTFKETLGVNVSDYQRAVSMDAATVYLREGMSVNETAGAVGYRSTSAFINVFHKHHQMTPAQWVVNWKKKMLEMPSVEN